nr:MAG TPA: hypothetical protein [Caudoviricetes sp.]
MVRPAPKTLPHQKHSRTEHTSITKKTLPSQTYLKYRTPFQTNQPHKTFIPVPHQPYR